MSRVQPTPFPSPVHQTRVAAFATIAVIAGVALAVVGGGALLLGQGPANQPAAAPISSATPAPTPIPSPTASPDEALVAELAAVMTSPYDAARVAALYAPNAVIHEVTANQTQMGLDEIATRIRYFNDQGFGAVVTSAPIRQDNFVAVFSRYGTGGDLSGRALVVYELKDGKVLNQWVYPAP
jgi:hypothetical protein